MFRDNAAYHGLEGIWRSPHGTLTRPSADTCRVRHKPGDRGRHDDGAESTPHAESRMYRTILVPLDGSPFSERALPLALRVARHTGAAVDLAHVHDPSVFPHHDAEGKQVMHAALHRLRGRIAARAGLRVTAHFLEGEIVPALRDRIDEGGVDLVVMATHGRGGMSRAWLGSVADALVRELRVPLLLTRPRAPRRRAAAAPPSRRTLVPLDGSPEAEGVLAHAFALGAANQSEVLLLRIVTPLPIALDLYPDGAMPLGDGASPIGGADIERQAREAERYLHSVAERVRRPGVPVNTHVLVNGQPARAILDFAHECDADLIALTTHGHGAFARLLLGSVADKVLRGATVPVLMYRPAAGAATMTEEGTSAQVLAPT